MATPTWISWSTGKDAAWVLEKLLDDASVEIRGLFTTIDRETSAQELGKSLVEHHLAACVQIDGPICSIYRWQGQVETAQEWRCTIKTTTDRFDELHRHIRSMHAYDVPEILASEICDSSPDYARWLREQVSDERSGRGSQARPAAGTDASG